MSGAASTAGSTPTRSATIGMREPIVVDQLQIASTVSETSVSRPCLRTRTAIRVDAKLVPSRLIGEADAGCVYALIGGLAGFNSSACPVA